MDGTEAQERTPIEQLQALANGAGMTVPVFARQVMGRAPLTAYRWMSGGPISTSVVEWLNRVQDVRYDQYGRLCVTLRKSPSGRRKATPEGTLEVGHG
jgi:hypothetical protein